ncbi:MAG: hypothetical protein ACI4PC_07250 [Oscillospiraceae bacterium]
MRDVFSFAAPWAKSVVVTENGESREAKAFIQPLSVTEPEERGRPLPCGVADDRRYRLIAAPGAILSEDGPVEIAWDGKRYVLLRRERLDTHWEGVLRLKAGGGDA